MKKITKYVPLWCLIMAAITLICAVIHIISVCSVAFSDFFNRTVSAFFRLIFAKITGWIPFSLAEILIILLPVIVGLIIFLAVKHLKKDNAAKIRFLASLLAVLTFFYSSFVLTFATAYRGSTLDTKLSLERAKLSADELYETSVKVLSELSEAEKAVKFKENGFSEMPYWHRGLNKELNSAYAKACEKYPFLQKMKSNVKSVLLSEPMTYTHISGVYTFFTGEANLNVNFPDYTLPFTMAHEMAHQRGIARENEANFVAFLVCIESDDAYIRYSAYLNMFEYLTNALYKADKEKYKAVVNQLSDNVIGEWIAYDDFFDKYRDSVASDVSNAVNNSYLQSQGQTSGTRSYGLVVELTVAYYKNK